MSYHTIEDGPWPQGTTVAVYATSALVGGQPSGSPVDTAVAQPDGTATFGGLTEGASYTAFGSGGSQVFEAINQESRLAVIQEAPLNAKTPPAGTAAVVWNGVTDDTAALAAIVALLPQTGSTNQRGGDVILPNGPGVIHGLSLDNTYNVALKGHGGRYGGTRLITNSTGATAMISAKSSGGLRIEDLALESSSAAFAGKMLDLDKGSGIDTALFHLKDLRVNMIVQAGSAVIGASLENAIAGVVEGCYFIGGKAGIRGRTSGASYSNAISIEGRCYFQNQDVAPILNPYEWVLDGCVFEPLRSGDVGAVLCEAGIPAFVLDVRDPWCGDGVISGGTGTWFHVHGTALLFRGGLVESGDTGIKLRTGEVTKGLHIGGVYFNGLAKGVDWNSISVNSGTVLPNTWGTVATRHANFSAFGTPSLFLDDDVRITRRDSSNLGMSHGLFFDNSSTVFQQQQAATSSFTHRVRLAADSQDRYQLAANGTITRGPGGSTVPTVTLEQGAGAPASTPANGSLYQRTDGVGTTDNLYVRRGGAWVGIA